MSCSFLPLYLSGRGWLSKSLRPRFDPEQGHYILKIGGCMNEPTIKVTKIKSRWHSRLYYKGKVLDEMACELKEDIGWICREMLRWFDKLGGNSEFAKAARHRQTNKIGKVWYKTQLEARKTKKGQHE